uniref:Uncharacterized protein n=1 Tax=Noctiluca scintillans TaxID=2966 RepID=A0A7S0ZYX0_NOCSC|mmetsp:Transcript_24343/g.63988  ORF Transcript_24343/g.63988 Transcript_24343/m.63988 type:complete len:327 (+) Transcript_24343:67-1047(+)
MNGQVKVTRPKEYSQSPLGQDSVKFGGPEYFAVPSYGGVEPHTKFAVVRPGAGTVLACVVIPWLMFSGVCYVNESSSRYYDGMVYAAVDGCFVMVALGFGVIAFQAMRKRQRGDLSQDPTWLTYICVMSLVGIAGGCICGQMNYVSYWRPYFDNKSLGTYRNVDAGADTGTMVMDAGTIHFTSDTYLDLTKAMGFTDSDTYCVAPITSPSNDGKRYDFWAVGLNCCTSGSNPNFECGEYNNPAAHSALRVLDDEEREFFRLAEQQAEVTYNIGALQPLFFTFMEYPQDELLRYYSDGVKYLILSVSGALAFMIVITAAFFVTWVRF